MVSRVRYVCEGVSIITGLGALAVGAYLSYESPITGSWVALTGSASAVCGAVSRSWRIRAYDGLDAIVESDLEDALEGDATQYSDR
ncbi:MAG: hypothetical protein ACMXYM_01750 [Candidatus Woesearchaeota archaeon]